MRRYWILIVLLLSACGGQTSTQEAPPGTFAPALRDQPTQPAPAWKEGAEVITLQNAPAITNIGRLDTASTASTVFAYSLSPDATRLAGLNNEQLIVWDLITGKIAFNTAREGATNVFYSADKTEIYTVDEVGRITIYDADSGAAKDGLDSQISFNGQSVYYADEGWVALGGSDGSVQVWNPSARQSLVTFSAGSTPVSTLAFSADGQQLATSLEGGTTQVWDWRNKKSVANIPTPALRMAFSPDGSQLAVGDDTKIDLWDVNAGKQIFTLNTGPGGVTSILTFSPDGQFIVNGGGIPAVTIWDTKTGKLVNTLPGVGGDSTSANFSPDGTLLVTSLLGGGVSLWDMSQIRATMLNRADLNIHTNQILYADWSGDGHLLLLFDATGPIQVWGIPAQPPTPTPTPSS
jgi:WD40 repeat protein